MPPKTLIASSTHYESVLLVQIQLNSIRMAQVVSLSYNIAPNALNLSRIRQFLLNVSKSSQFQCNLPQLNSNVLNLPPTCPTCVEFIAIQPQLVSNQTKYSSIRLQSSQFNLTCLKSSQNVAICPQIASSLSKCVELIVDRPVLFQPSFQSVSLTPICFNHHNCFQLFHLIIPSKLFPTYYFVFTFC